MEVEKADKQEGRFKLKEWNSVVMWSWNTDVDTCAICRSKTDDAVYRLPGEGEFG